MNDTADSELGYRVERETANGEEIAILVLDGDFDLPAVERFEEAVEETRTGEPAGVVVDTSRLRFIDSSGLNELARMRENDGELPVEFVVSPGSAVDRVLEVSGLSDVLAGTPDRHSAVAALNR